jgi:glycosyltransferase involved in cell wall biosynthesis
MPLIKDMEVTVFTPSYNRTEMLTRLFESLSRQSNFDFEWLIVDDGSTEDVRPVIDFFKRNTNSFPIAYIRQENQGKHIAINNGVALAKGKLFFVVDNDDYLSDDAIQQIIEAWAPIQNNPDYVGIAFNKCIIGGTPLGAPKYDELDCTPMEFRFKLNGKGDKAEVIRTSFFKKYPFPVNGEKFCPEALFFNRISQKLRYINRNIYYCEYLADGLTSKIVEIRKNSPINTCLYYRELADSDISLKQKFKALVNYYRFARYLSDERDQIQPKCSLLVKRIIQVSLFVLRK